MIYARELASDLWGEIMPLLRRHWEEIAHYQDIALDPDVEAYSAMEGAGILRCYTARENNELVGYAVYKLGRHAHYDSIQALQDVLYLAPEYRGQHVGSDLIDYADACLADEGVQAVYHHVKVRHDFGKLLMAHGYELIDYVYGKRLD